MEIYPSLNRVVICLPKVVSRWVATSFPKISASNANIFKSENSLISGVRNILLIWVSISGVKSSYGSSSGTWVSLFFSKINGLTGAKILRALKSFLIRYYIIFEITSPYQTQVGKAAQMFVWKKCPRFSNVEIDYLPSSVFVRFGCFSLKAES